MLIEQQIAERRDRAAAAPLKILKRPAEGPYGDYTVKSASGRTYRVAVRGLGLFENYCSCPDFAINTLGTCKHVEAILLRPRKRHQKVLEAARYKRTRASISLQYGDSIEVRLRACPLIHRSVPEGTSSIRRFANCQQPGTASSQCKGPGTLAL